MPTETSIRWKNGWRSAAAAHRRRNRFATAPIRRSAFKPPRKPCQNRKSRRRTFMPSDALTVQVERRIYLIRGEKVMLDADLAWLYSVETKVLNRAVKRNKDRFPTDFMFQLTRNETEGSRLQIGTSTEPTARGMSALRFQSGTSKSGRGGRRQYCYYAYAPARDASFQRRSRSQIERIGEKVRQTVQGCFRCDSRANDSAGKAKTPDRAPFL